MALQLRWFSGCMRYHLRSQSSCRQLSLFPRSAQMRRLQVYGRATAFVRLRLPCGMHPGLGFSIDMGMAPNTASPSRYQYSGFLTPPPSERGLLVRLPLHDDMKRSPLHVALSACCSTPTTDLSCCADIVVPRRSARPIHTGGRLRAVSRAQHTTSLARLRNTVSTRTLVHLVWPNMYRMGGRGEGRAYLSCITTHPTFAIQPSHSAISTLTPIHLSMVEHVFPRRVRTSMPQRYRAE